MFRHASHDLLFLPSIVWQNCAHVLLSVTSLMLALHNGFGRMCLNLYILHDATENIWVTLASGGARTSNLWSHFKVVMSNTCSFTNLYFFLYVLWFYTKNLRESCMVIWPHSSYWLYQHTGILLGVLGWENIYPKVCSDTHISPEELYLDPHMFQRW